MGNKICDSMYVNYLVGGCRESNMNGRDYAHCLFTYEHVHIRSLGLQMKIDVFVFVELFTLFLLTKVHYLQKYIKSKSK